MPNVESSHVLQDLLDELRAGSARYDSATQIILAKLSNSNTQDNFSANVESQRAAIAQRLERFIEKVEQFMDIPLIDMQHVTIDSPVKTLAALLWNDKENTKDLSEPDQMQISQARADIVNTVNLCNQKRNECYDYLVKAIKANMDLLTQLTEEYRVLLNAIEQGNARLRPLQEKRKGLEERAISLANKIEQIRKESLTLEASNAQDRKKLSLKMQVFDEATKLLRLDEETLDGDSNKINTVKNGLEELRRIAELTNKLARIKITHDSENLSIFEIYTDGHLVIRVEISGSQKSLMCSVIPENPHAFEFANKFKNALNHTLKFIGKSQPLLDTVAQVLAFIEIAPQVVAAVADKALTKLSKEINPKGTNL